MVTIKAYHARIKSDGTKFFTLELQEGLEMVQSQETGKWYAVVRHCSIPTTFDEETAKSLIGSTIHGKVVRVQSEPYDYLIKNTGQVIQLAHSYQYQPDDSPVVINQIAELV